MLRVVVVVAGLASAFPAMAGEMTASEARQFVVDCQKEIERSADKEGHPHGSSRPFRRDGILAFEQRLSRFRASVNLITIA